MAGVAENSWGGGVSMFGGGNFPPKRCLDKTLPEAGWCDRFNFNFCHEMQNAFYMHMQCLECKAGDHFKSVE